MLFCVGRVWVLSSTDRFRPTVLLGCIATLASGAFAQNSAELHSGSVHERQITGTEVHSYYIRLPAGGYACILLEQGDADLKLTLVGSSGSRDFDGRWHGPEPASILAEAAESYRVEVRPVQKGLRATGYKLRVPELRPGKPQDVTRVSAQLASTQGKQLIAQGTGQSFKSAVDAYTRALEWWREVGDRYAEAQTLNSLGYVAGVLGDNSQALKQYSEALRLREEMNDLWGQSETLGNIGAIRSAEGQKKEAVTYYERALQLGRATGDRARQAQMLNNIGVVYTHMGENRRALEQYQAALPMWRAVADRRGEVQTLIGIAAVHSWLSENQKALDSLKEAAAIAGAESDDRGQAVALNNSGHIHTVLGERESALARFYEALELFQKIADRRLESYTWINIGRVYADSEDPDGALAAYQKALALSVELKDRHGEARTLSCLAHLYWLGRENEKAIEFAHRALPPIKAVADRRGEAGVLNTIGLAHLSSGENEKALTSFNLALELFRATADQNGEANTLLYAARAEQARGNLDDARQLLESALALVETLRDRVIHPELRSTYLASKQSYFEAYVHVLMRLHRLHPLNGYDVMALEASEHARARSLIETLTEVRAEIRRGSDHMVLERERALQQRINAKAERQTQILAGKHRPEEAASLKAEIEELLREYHELEADIRKTSPKYAALQHPRPLTVREIQDEVLDNDTLLLEYAIGDERSYLWAVTPDMVRTFELPGRTEIERLTRAAYGVWSRAQAADETVLRNFAAVLLDPVSGLLGRKRLLIVADGPLQYVPFSAVVVQTGGAGLDPAPLVTEHEIVSLPSASTLAILRRELAGRQRAPHAVAILADPVFDRDDPRLKRSRARPPGVSAPGGRSEVERSAAETGAGILRRLPFTRREADAIAALVPGDQYLKMLDFHASRAAATSARLSRYRFVHIGTHGFLNDQHPELSGLVLSLVDEQGRAEDGFLRLHDIYNLELPVELVVLSACRTGLGKEVRGEGLVGLTRGFMYAGAARVVVSLWKVDDLATAELMGRFYKAMLGPAKMRPAAALSAAQAAMSKEERWRSPYYWAGFVLHGEWN